jgi:acyl carrier protein
MADVEDFLRTELGEGRGRGSIEPDENLIKRGILDSLGLMQLVTFLEERFGIEVEDQDLVPDNFRSLNEIGAFLEQKRGGTPTPGSGPA